MYKDTNTIRDLLNTFRKIDFATSQTILIEAKKFMCIINGFPKDEYNIPKPFGMGSCKSFQEQWVSSCASIYLVIHFEKFRNKDCFINIVDPSLFGYLSELAIKLLRTNEEAYEGFDQILTSLNKGVDIRIIDTQL